MTGLWPARRWHPRHKTDRPPGITGDPVQEFGAIDMEIGRRRGLGRRQGSAIATLKILRADGRDEIGRIHLIVSQKALRPTGRDPGPRNGRAVYRIVI